MWIEPLNLQLWLMNVLSGSKEIFTAVAMLFVLGLCAYFRMTILLSIFMFGIFLVMFAGYVDPSFLFLILAIGAILAGLWIKKIVTS